MGKHWSQCHGHDVSLWPELFPKLQTGLDLNVKFNKYVVDLEKYLTGARVEDMEYTEDLTIFDTLSVPLYHGWLVDPQVPICLVTLGCCLQTNSARGGTPDWDQRLQSTHRVCSQCRCWGPELLNRRRQSQTAARRWEAVSVCRAGN